MLEKKNGTTYDTVDLSSYVDASYQNFSANNYSIGDVTSWTSNIMNDVAKGTYRFVFKLYSGTRIVNTEKEIFIVK